MNVISYGCRVQRDECHSWVGSGSPEGVSRHGGRVTNKYVVYTLPIADLELLVADQNTEKIIELIMDATYPGKAGEGRIFVRQVAAVIRVYKGERYDTSL